MPSSDPRIDAMLRNDQRGVAAFVISLWLAILFVYYVAWQVIPDPMVRLVLGVAALAVLILNTSSMTALVRHYREDKEHLYGLDLRFLDAAKRRAG